MAKKDPRIDNYISKSADFAKTILTHLRAAVHKACPEAEETIKWGMPYFIYKGILCGMASFKNHCAFVFPKGSMMKDPNRILDVKREKAMGQFGRITSLKDLPSEKILISYIKDAVKLNDENVKLPKRERADKKEIIVPDDLMKALKRNKKAYATFESFNYGNKKDYVEWITEAKNQDTRNKRLATAIEWMAEGKIRNWKYVR